MNITSILSTTAICLSIHTALGVLIHDTKIDQATLQILTPPAPTGVAAGSQAKLASDWHPHAERGSLAQAVRDTNKAAHPRVQPRNDNRKHLLQKRVTKGVFAFDGYYMPIE